MNSITQVLMFLLLFSQGISHCVAQVNLGATASLEHLENPSRLHNPDNSDLLSTVSIDGNLARETQRFSMLLDYRASRSDYKNNILEDRETIDGSSSFVWKVSPDILQWNLSNSRSNQLISAKDPDTPDNRQIISRTSTGPSLTLPFGAVNYLDLQVDYSLADYEEAQLLDQERKSISVNFTRSLSRRITASIRSNLMETSFDSKTVSKYKIFSLSAIASLSSATYNTSLELGQFETKRTGQGKSSNPLIRLNGNYKLSSFSEITASYSRTVEDLLSDIRRSQEDQEQPIEREEDFENRFGDSNSASLYIKTSASLAYSFVDTSRYNLRIKYSISERKFEQLNDQETDERISLNLSIPFSTKTNLSFRTRYSELQLSNLNPKQKLSEVSASLSYKLSNNFRLNFSLRNIDQKSKNVNDTYDGTNIFIGLTYRR
ncbi:MAG: hypothetical protein COA96_03620 [SAR86 cluster bacterium]|uniref:TIGR03016 family PEP-CTERM system-associated outer membrane protein n=1 Tax=SAR86 cluster bacterium TaxID=2030880 RepID=A0A2A5B735_9GAMM|nr:MAG: hypothetical protein COA96_03620 [SAR86 cluster bacterium]